MSTERIENNFVVYVCVITHKQTHVTLADSIEVTYQEGVLYHFGEDQYIDLECFKPLIHADGSLRTVLVGY